MQGPPRSATQRTHASSAYIHSLARASRGDTAAKRRRFRNPCIESLWGVSWFYSKSRGWREFAGKARALCLHRRHPVLFPRRIERVPGRQGSPGGAEGSRGGIPWSVPIFELSADSYVWGHEPHPEGPR